MVYVHVLGLAAVSNAARFSPERFDEGFLAAVERAT